MKTRFVTGTMDIAKCLQMRPPQLCSLFQSWFWSGSRPICLGSRSVSAWESFSFEKFTHISNGSRPVSLGSRSVQKWESFKNGQKGQKQVGSRPRGQRSNKILIGSRSITTAVGPLSQRQVSGATHNVAPTQFYGGRGFPPPTGNRVLVP